MPRERLVGHPEEGTAVHNPGATLRRWFGPWLLVVATAALLAPWYAPANNELVYMLVLRSKADPTFLAGDWTYSGVFSEHFVFNTLLGPLTSVISIEAIAWVGRVSAWALAAAVLLALAASFGSRPWPAAAALVVWLAIGQSVVAETWMVKTFEAKTLAYPLLVGALVAAMRGRIPWAAALVGLSLTFHPAVGLWGALALGTALLIERSTRWQTIRWSWLAAVGAAPGLIAALWGLSRGGTEDWEYAVLARFPFHLDPFEFPRRGMVLLALVLVWSLVWGWVLWSDVRFRIVTWFQIGLAVLFAVGVLARLFEAWQALVYFPFRLLPLFAPLLALLYAARLVDRARWETFRENLARRSIVALSLSALAGLTMIWTLVLVNPAVTAINQVQRNLEAGRLQTDDTAEAFRWVADHLPADAVVVSPPWRLDASYLTERSHVASYFGFRYDESAEWRDRIRALLGSDFDGGDPARVMFDLYPRLTEEDVEVLADRYGVTHIVTEGTLDFVVVHEVGNVRVYESPVHRPFMRGWRRW
jgi:hypothetical protein